MSEQAPGLYKTYAAYKRYVQPSLNAKQIGRFDREVWHPAGCSPDMAFLEIGCGTGLFLSYLEAKGAATFHGVDHDPEIAQILPQSLQEHFFCGDVRHFLDQGESGPFDRIFLFDVLEHFSPEDAVALLEKLSRQLKAGGQIVIKVPNAASPWGASYQFGDLTHITAYCAGSLRQLAEAARFDVVRCYPQIQGSRRRQVTDRIVNRVLSWALLTPPEFWSANLYCIMAPKTEGSSP